MQDRLFRALAILRVVLLANTIGLNLLRHENFEHPTAGLLVVLGLSVWTGVAIWAYADPARRTPPLLVTDLLVAVAGLAVTPWVKGPDFNATVAGFWVMGAMFAWAIQWRWAGGLTAAVVLCAADLAIRDSFTQSNYGNLFLLMIGGPIIGYVCESLQRSAMAVAAAERTAATEAERARLARAVHDGVLQVLALVQRRGGELGGEAGELGRLAGEQEIRLRALIRAQDSVVPPAFGDADGRVDLAMELARFEEHGSVTVSLPGPPVPLPARTVDEVVAAVAACLDNVLLHVGRSAPAWVLLEAFPDRVVVSVRDEGPGIPAGRLEAAQGDGRLGRRRLDPRPDRRAGWDGRADDRDLRDRVGADGAGRCWTHQTNRGSSPHASWVTGDEAGGARVRAQRAAAGRTRPRFQRTAACESKVAADEQDDAQDRDEHQWTDRPGLAQGEEEGVVASTRPP